MTVIEKLKAESMRLRKERSPIAASIQFAISEIEKVGKNAGNRASTEDEAIKVIQKITATLRENLKVTTEVTAAENVNAELAVLESVLPQMVSEEDVRAYLKNCFVEAPQNKGAAMKVLKTKFGALVDMKRAGEIITEMYGV